MPHITDDEYLLKRKNIEFNLLIKTRPSKSDLAELGIIDDSGMAPSIQPMALLLQWRLSHRPSMEALILKGIIPPYPLSPISPIKYKQNNNHGQRWFNNNNKRNHQNNHNRHHIQPWRRDHFHSSSTTPIISIDNFDNINHQQPLQTIETLQQYRFTDFMIVL